MIRVFIVYEEGPWGWIKYYDFMAKKSANIYIRETNRRTGRNLKVIGPRYVEKAMFAPVEHDMYGYEYHGSKSLSARKVGKEYA